MATESPSSVRKATGGAPILKQSKFKIPGTDKFAKVIDFLRRQLHSDSLVLTNDKFVSVEHRVLTNNTKPRGSIASFFSTFIRPNSTVYGPIKKLLSEENPPKYRDFTIPEYSSLYLKKGLVKAVYSVLMDDQLQFPCQFEGIAQTDREAQFQTTVAWLPTQRNYVRSCKRHA